MKQFSKSYYKSRKNLEVGQNNLINNLEEIKKIKTKNSNLDYINYQNAIILEKISKININNNISKEIKELKEELLQIKFLVS